MRTPNSRSTAKRGKEIPDGNPVTQNQPLISATHLDAIHRTEVANIIAKLKSGKTLSARERKVIEKAGGGEVPVPHGRQFAAMRWTIDNAATEFDIHKETVSKRLRSSSTKAGDDGKFSTAQIVRAIFGDAYTEKVRKMTADANNAELKATRTLEEIARMAELRWRDAMADVTKKIQSLQWLRGDQLEQVFAAIRSVDLSPWDEVEIE